MPTGDAYSSGHLVPSLWDLHMFYLLRPILFPNLSLFLRTMLFEYPSVLSRFSFIPKRNCTCILCFSTSSKSRICARFYLNVCVCGGGGGGVLGKTSWSTLLGEKISNVFICAGMLKPSVILSMCKALFPRGDAGGLRWEYFLRIPRLS